VAFNADKFMDKLPTVIFERFFNIARELVALLIVLFS
jgi:hypothetical protein